MATAKEMGKIHAQVMALDVEAAKQRKVIADAGASIAALEVERAVLFEKLDALRLQDTDAAQ